MSGIDVAEQASPQTREVVVWMISLDQEQVDGGQTFRAPLGGNVEWLGGYLVLPQVRGGGTMASCMDEDTSQNP